MMIGRAETMAPVFPVMICKILSEQLEGVDSALSSALDQPKYNEMSQKRGAVGLIL